MSFTNSASGATAEWLEKKTGWRAISQPSLFFALALSLAAPLFLLGQADSRPAPSPSELAAAANRPHYIVPSTLNGLVSDYIKALGPELNKAGSERVVLQGSVTYGQKSAAETFVFTRELDQSFRLDIGGSNQRSLIASGLQTPTPRLTSSLSSVDQALLEMLSSDSPEAFLLGLEYGVATRRLGTRFRTDDGSTKDYTGPFYDIYMQLGPVKALPGAPVRQKLYYFDSVSKLFVKSRYQLDEGGVTKEIQVVYDGWTNQNGVSVPGTITRLEDGTPTLTLKVTASAPAASANDGLFAIQ